MVKVRSSNSRHHCLSIPCHCRAQRSKAGAETRSSNPFQAQPSSASMAHRGSTLGVGPDGRVLIPAQQLMQDLDSPANLLEGLEDYQWERFITARLRKVESEQRVSARRSMQCVCVHVALCQMDNRWCNESSAAQFYHISLNTCHL